jgi:hypothetical protein
MKIELEKEELEKIIKEAFRHGQINREMMEAGLERSEIEDYTFSVMRKQMLVQMMRKDEESGLYGDEPQSIH